nr:RNA polymerase sigma-70 factor [uncultured Bacteroides sp.]
MTLQNEHFLIADLKKGSKEAFDEIYRLYAGRLLAYCTQYTKCREDAEEIVQDVFVALWNSRQTIRQEETLRSLLFTISKHRVINAYRSTLNSPVYEDYVDYQNELPAGEDYHRLEYEQYVRIVKDAIRRLPSTQQRVITLSRFSQLSNKEIAEHLSLSEQTVKNQLSIGLKTLRELLAKVLVLFVAGLILNIVNRFL